MDLATYSKGNIGRHYMVADGFVNGPVVNRNGAMHMYTDRQIHAHTQTQTQTQTHAHTRRRKKRVAARRLGAARRRTRRGWHTRCG